jgi:hypothetical protein
MKTNLPKPLCSWALAAVVSIAGLRAQTPAPATVAADGTVQLPTYEVASPKFSSTLKDLYERLDSIGDPHWVDAQGSALIQAIIWRHGYLHTHPSDAAVIYIDRGGSGRVHDATTVYSEDGKLYANSYNLGDKVRMGNLTAADINDTAKIEQWLGGIHDQYQSPGPNVLYSFGGGGGGRGFRGGHGGGGGIGLSGSASGAMPYNADVGYTVWGAGGPIQFVQLGNSSAEIAALRNSGAPDTGQIVPANMNMFYAGGPFAQLRLAREEAEWEPYHEPPAIMLDAIYRALRDPDRAGVVPVALSPVDHRAAIVFDWEGIHYAYWPYVGTVGQPIPSNPVTGLPYLCVKDSGLIESIYFSATYQKLHPGEKVVVVPGDDPSAAYTAKGRLVLFSPSLNHFAVMGKEDPSAINDPEALRSSVAKVKTTLASLPVPAATNGRPHATHVPETLLGDTADSQMRRIYLAFQQAGIPVYLKSGDAPSLSFSWQGVNYIYGPDQQVRVTPNLASNG